MTRSRLLAHSAVLSLAIGALVACSSTTTTPSGGASTTPSAECNQIEADYKAAATGASALTCATGDDCGIDSGLCKPDGTVVVGNAKGTYSKATATKLKTLSEQWAAKNCNQDKFCNASAGGVITCEANACKAE